jgi:hypothetical protein
MSSNNKKRTMREDIEYRLGLYFSIKSGVMYVRDEKYGSQEEILTRLEHEVTTDVKFLLKKEHNIILDSQLSFRDVALFYKNYLMKK